ncbi:MAG: efflux RND transporter periplasmic adaptor subunit [Ktedonobacterales bacterium]
MSDGSGRDNELNNQFDNLRDDGVEREDLTPTLTRSRTNLPRFSSTNLSMRKFVASINSRRVVAVAILILLVAILVAIILHSLPPSLSYARVSTGNLTVSFPTTGVLQGTVYGANFVEPGTLAEIDATVGQAVSQGQVLAKLDTKLLDDAANSAQATVNAAQTQLSDAQATQSADLQQTSANVAAALDQEQAAIAACNSSATCIQSAEDAYSAAQSTAAAENQAAQSAVDAAQSSLTTAESELQEAEDAQAGATLRAGHSGTVASISSAVGDTVGGPGTTFITLVDLGAIQVRANVNVAQVGSITSRTVFRLVVPAVGKQEFGGTLGGISPIGEQVHGVLTYQVLIEVDMQSTNGASLLPGMSANVLVITQQRTGVLLIPVSAVSFAEAAGNPHYGGFLPHSRIVSVERQADQLLVELQNSDSVTAADNPTPSYVLQYSHGKWVIKPIVLGLTDGHVYEVLAGLEVGERVVTGEAGGAVTVPTPTPPVTN